MAEPLEKISFPSPTRHPLHLPFFSRTVHGSFSEIVYENETSAQAFLSIILFFTPSSKP